MLLWYVIKIWTRWIQMTRQSSILVSLSPISYIHLYSTVPWVKENWPGRTWNKSVVVTDYCLDDKGSLPSRGRNYSLLRGGPPNPYQMDTGGGGVSSLVKSTGSWSWQLSSFIFLNLRMRGTIPSYSHRAYVFMALCLVAHRLATTAPLQWAF